MATKKAVKSPAKKAVKRASASPGKRSSTSQGSKFEEQFHSAVVEKLDSWVATVSEPAKPLMGTSGGGGKAGSTFSPAEILTHVKKRTPLGKKVVANWAELALKSIRETPLA